MEYSLGLRPVLSVLLHLLDLHQRLSRAFEAHYRGAAVEGFYEYLTHNEKLFKIADNPKYYAKLCSIVQGSGTGKSRMLAEVKDVSFLNEFEMDETISVKQQGCCSDLHELARGEG